MREITLAQTIKTIDKLLNFIKSQCDEAILNRNLAVYDLSRKMRACITALIPIQKHDILCVPTNLLYRCMITDLLTLLLITVVDEEEFEKIMHTINYCFARSFKNALNAGTKVKQDLYPNDLVEIEKQYSDYFEQQYDDFKDYLSSTKGEEWVFNKKPITYIKGEKFDGSIDSIYRVLLNYPNVKHLASMYEYYKLFSQSEHFSLMNRAFIYKQDFHENYYNKTRGFICLGVEFVYEKFSSK